MTETQLLSTLLKLLHLLCWPAQGKQRAFSGSFHWLEHFVDVSPHKSFVHWHAALQIVLFSFSLVWRMFGKNQYNIHIISIQYISEVMAYISKSILNHSLYHKYIYIFQGSLPSRSGSNFVSLFYIVLHNLLFITFKLIAYCLSD